MRGGKVNIGKAFKRAGRRLKNTGKQIKNVFDQGKQIKNAWDDTRDAFKTVARKTPAALRTAGMAIRNTVPRHLLKAVAASAATAGLNYIGQPQLAPAVNKSVSRGIDNAYNATRKKKFNNPAPAPFSPAAPYRPAPRPRYIPQQQEYESDEDDFDWYTPQEGPPLSGGAVSTRRKTVRRTGGPYDCKPCMVKGSQAAHDNMAYLRSLKRSKK